MKWLKAIAIVCVAASSLWAASVDLNTTGAGGTSSAVGGVADGTGNWTEVGGSGSSLSGNATVAGLTATSSATFRDTEFSIAGDQFVLGSGRTMMNGASAIGVLTVGAADGSTGGLDLSFGANPVVKLWRSGSDGIISVYDGLQVETIRMNAAGQSYFTAAASFGFGTSTPLANLHANAPAGETGNVFVVTTDTIRLFQVQGTSITARLPIYTTNDITAIKFRGDGSLLTGIIAGGSASIAVGTGTPTNIGVVTSSPTAILNFDKNQFNGTVSAGTSFFVTIKPEIDLTASSVTVTNAGFKIIGSTISAVTGKLGIGTFAPSYMLHITTTAGTTSTLMTVSTGPIDLFKVNGTSVAMRVPLYMNNNDLNDVGTIAGGAVSGNFVLSDTLHSSVTFVTSGGTVTLTANGVQTMAATGLFGNTSNANAIVIAATTTVFNSNTKSTGTHVATNIDPVLWTDITISSDSLVAGGTFWMLTAPSNSAITITSIVPMTYSVAASSANFSLQEKTVQSANGSQIFTGTYSTGTWNHMNPITSFADSSIAAGSSLFLVTKDGGSTAGTPRALSVIVYYKYATP